MRKWTVEVIVVPDTEDNDFYGAKLGWSEDDKSVKGPHMHASAIEMWEDDKERLLRYASVIRDALNQLEQSMAPCSVCGRK